MKIQCDVCSRDEASVFCCADEAALCNTCDRRVHRANKLAGKHRRFSLSAQSHPLCDVCQERRGFVFCQEDRAILCRDCDASIHTANHLTMKHSRFVLTGVRLSSTPISSSFPLPEAVELDKNTNTLNGSEEKINQHKAIVADESVVSTTSANSSGSSSSSISEYLIKMLPGYRVEDLLVDDAMTAADCLYKSDEVMPFLEPDLDRGGLAAVVEEHPIWVPHVPQIPPPNLLSAVAGASVHYHQGIGAKEGNQSHQYHGLKGGREQRSDDSFMVPQITTPASSNNKRPRPSSSLWYF